MERSSVLRWILIGLGVFLILQLLDPFGSKKTELQPLTPELPVVKAPRTPEQTCDIWTPTFRAVLSTRSATLKNFQLLTAKYRMDGKPTELSTTPDLELHRQLLVNFRNGSPKDPSWQVDYDAFDWTITQADGKSCQFRYQDAEVELTKTISATGKPYELTVETTVKNLASEPRKHALTIGTEAWRRQSEIHGGMFQVSPYVTHVECVLDDKSAVRLQPGEFEPDDFKKPEFAKNPINPGDWYQPKGSIDVAAVSNAYFSHALVPVSGPAAPACQLLIEQRWDSARHKNAGDDPNGGFMYRARLAYPEAQLAPGQSHSYRVLSYVGPKERTALSQAAGGKYNLDELIDLGFFSRIAKILVAFLLFVYNLIPNWGVAIVILTVTARVLLFPLSVPSIKNMMRMRELKPELDALSDKYKDDMQAKGLAQMELWRKHDIKPLKGCLPQLASMPVWFALYTTLQTAVELYNIPFLWFPDLSRPDPYFILPVIIGGTYYVQQKLMPMTGGDPMQQKMMLYLMPGMFTVMMLFLPAGLGVYMFTNSVLGIVQQQVVEWQVRRTTGGGSGDIKLKVKEDPESGPPSKSGKGSKLVGRSPVLGKGKA